MVHRFKGHATCHSTIANHGNHIVVLMLEVARHCKANTCRNGGAGMAHAKIVIHTFAALRKARYTHPLTQGFKILIAPRQKLMYIGLVAYIPNKLVLWEIVHIVKGQCDFHNP